MASKRLLGFNVGDAATAKQEAVRRAVETVRPHRVLLMENAFWLADELPPECFVVGRAYSLERLFGLFRDEGRNMDAGAAMARAVLARYGGLARVDSWADRNEPVFPKNDPDGAWLMARLLGAWGAGFATAMLAAGKTPFLWNFSMGTPEADQFAMCWSSFLQHAPGIDPCSVIVSYHGYTNGNHRDAHFLELRPWSMWGPELERLGLPKPRVMFGECGFDARIGWRGIWSPERYGTYMAALPDLVPECEGFMQFCVGGTEKWEHECYDVDPVTYPGDVAILEPMGRKNDEMEDDMPDNPTVRDYLADMWRRAGVQPNEENDAMWRYCLDLAKRGSKAIIPLPSPDGHYQNWNHERYVFGYTAPVPLWMEKGVWEVHEGFPPLS